MLTIDIFKNAYHNAKFTQTGEIHNVTIGFLEACLVHYGIITPDKPNLNDYREDVMYANFYFWEFYRRETKSEVIIRLSEEFLNTQP